MSFIGDTESGGFGVNVRIVSGAGSLKTSGSVAISSVDWKY